MMAGTTSAHMPGSLRQLSAGSSLQASILLAERSLRRHCARVITHGHAPNEGARSDLGLAGLLP